MWLTFVLLPFPVNCVTPPPPDLMCDPSEGGQTPWSRTTGLNYMTVYKVDALSPPLPAKMYRCITNNLIIIICLLLVHFFLQKLLLLIL